MGSSKRQPQPYEERKEGYLYKVHVPNSFNKLSIDKNFLCYQTYMWEDGYSTGYMLSAHMTITEAMTEWGIGIEDCTVEPATPHIGFNASDGIARFVVIDVGSIPGADLSYVTVIWFFRF